jgi:hypothetical protein
MSMCEGKMLNPTKIFNEKEAYQRMRRDSQKDE